MVVVKLEHKAMPDRLALTVRLEKVVGRKAEGRGDRTKCPVRRNRSLPLDLA